MNVADPGEDATLQRSAVEVTGCLRDHLDAMTTQIVDGIRNAFEEDGVHASAVPLDDHMSSILSVAHTVIDMLVEQRSLTTEEVDVIRKIGTRRARQGLSPKSVQRSVAIGRDIGWDQLIACTEHLPMTIRGSVLARLARDLFRISDEVLGAMTEGHLQSREGNSFFAQLLVGEQPAVHSLPVRASGLGINLEKPHGLFVVATAHGPFSGVCEVVERIADELGGYEVAVATSEIPHGAVVLETRDEQAWEQQRRRAEAIVATSPTVALAAGLVVGSLAIRRAYQDALLVVPIALSTKPDGSLIRAQELLLHRLFVELDDELKQRFLNETIGPLLALRSDVRDRYLGTLRALMSSGRVAAAARALAVSEQTVHNRLATVRHILGRQVRTDEFAVALCLMDVLGAPNVEKPKAR